jgi:hypothetical protein
VLVGIELELGTLSIGIRQILYVKYVAGDWDHILESACNPETRAHRGHTYSSSHIPKSMTGSSLKPLAPDAELRDCLKLMFYLYN